MALIAITGGIGAGKTTLTSQFKAFGAAVADADDIAHQAYNPGNAAYVKIVERWGERILDADGLIDRKAVASIVFGNASELEWLNGIVHPFVLEEIKKQSRDKILFCAVPLLYESGWSDDCDFVVSTWCPPDVQKERLKKRGWSDEEIQRRIKSQISMDVKLHRGDFGVITSCSWECLREQCRRIYEIILLRVQTR